MLGATPSGVVPIWSTNTKATRHLKVYNCQSQYLLFPNGHVYPRLSCSWWTGNQLAIDTLGTEPRNSLAPFPMGGEGGMWSKKTNLQNHVNFWRGPLWNHFENSSPANIFSSTEQSGEEGRGEQWRKEKHKEGVGRKKEERENNYLKISQQCFDLKKGERKTNSEVIIASPTVVLKPVINPEI